MKSKHGFTMIELCCVIAVIATLASTVMPMYNKSVIRAKESALKQNLHTFRKLISDYYKDNERWPNKLEDLVSSGYLRSIPDDPFTQRNDTWIYIPSEDGKDDLYDVKSGSDETSLDGIKYSDF